LRIHTPTHHTGIATILCSIGRLLASLFGAVAPGAAVAMQLPTDSGLVPLQQFGNLGLIVSGLHECVNLISFSLVEVFVVHKQLLPPSLETYNAKHHQLPKLKLIKVALRALIRQIIFRVSYSIESSIILISRSLMSFAERYFGEY